MYILGISCYYHDASATLVKDGIVVAAAEEERFTRKKHDTSFPINAIRFCLRSQKINIENIDHIGFYEKPMLKFERILYQHLDNFPRGYKTFLSSMPSWLSQKLRMIKRIEKLGYKKDVMFIHHHMSHAASAFLPSPYDNAAILTIDGVGEWTTTSYGIGKGSEIRLLKEIRFPHSIGLLYSTITAYLGFSVNNSEYKVMGLSAYGNTDRITNPFYRRLKNVIEIKNDGSYSLHMKYFRYHFSDRMPSKHLCRLLGGPPANRDSTMTKRHRDIAAALQMITEDVLTLMLNHIHTETKQDNIVLAGGVALNSVFNGKILRSTPFKQVWIQPNASDGGTSMGVALYIWNSILGNTRKYTLTSALLGPSFSTDEIQDFLDKNNIKYSTFKSDEDLIKKTAQLCFDNLVVGWFQDRMEWGPRALGSRSILANPCNKDAKELLNSKVKHRERFRPFAPVVCHEDAEKYFLCDIPMPQATDFMTMVYPIRKEWQEILPSVTHADGTGRLQTIRPEQNYLYYQVIKEFGRLSGIPILINTSFNIRGEPIVCSPKDAYRCMMGTGIDYLVIGKFLVKRTDNPRHIWDSERLARD